MGKQRLAEFDALIGNYYGRGDAGGVNTDPRKRIQDLLSTYYGNPSGPWPSRVQGASVSLSLGCDDGEVLSQPASPTSSARTSRPASRTTVRATSLEYEEYVIDGCDTATAPDQAQVTPDVASDQPLPVQAVGPSTDNATMPVVTNDVPTQAQPDVSGDKLSPAEADIVSDIQSIIRGQKVYEKDRGLVDRSTTSTAASVESSGRNAPYNGVNAQPKNGHEIFDRIAQSMQFANAYDLGTVALENRFAEFDRQEDQRRKGVPKKNGATPPQAAPLQPPQALQPSAPAAQANAGSPDLARATTADFVADLDAIKAKPGKPVPQGYSKPFYDTGEHVLAAGGEYPDMLRVGKGLAVRLSYGQVIAMGDLYDTVDDLFNADPAELERLKTLIIRSTTYYEGKRSNKSLDVSNDAWDAATKGRYLKLAENNYEHFSPPTVAMGSGVATMHGDNRSQWERYHRMAIEDAQQEGLAHGPNESVFFERALVINAFGDHFLTDAFAAGHLVNKEGMIGRFKAAFFNGSDLSSAGEKFFERVADAAWKGDVAAKFSKLETVDYPTVHVPWWLAIVPGGLVGAGLAGRDVPVPFHPNIDSASRFASLLKEAAKQQPERIGNLVVKALHDYLNEHGIEVTNGAGDGTWMLPGDGTLMVGTGKLTPANLGKNLEIMRKAVQQSIDDINSPRIRASNLNLQTFFDGVWRYVPRPTAAAQTQLTTLIRDYTDPNSATLVKAAADIVTAQLESFIKLLVDEHKLQPA